jgi:hypothetical protein
MSLDERLEPVRAFLAGLRFPQTQGDPIPRGWRLSHGEPMELMVVNLLPDLLEELDARGRAIQFYEDSGLQVALGALSQFLWWGAADVRCGECSSWIRLGPDGQVPQHFHGRFSCTDGYESGLRYTDGRLMRRTSGPRLLPDGAEISDWETIEVSP